MSTKRPQFRRYRRDQDGNMAMILAIALIPICMVIGLSFDMQRARQAKNSLQVAVDAASLAAARQMQKNIYAVDTVKSVALDYFHADLASSHSVTCPDPTITIDTEEYLVLIDAKCTMPTTFAGFMGQENWELGAAASAKSTVTRIDLALMLDVSGSMAGSRMTALQTSAKEAVDVLLAPDTGNGGRIALAPYSWSVNAGDFAEDAVGDDWVGYQAGICPTAEITPLTQDAELLHTQIDALTADGSTAGHIGIAWSWYLISDDWDNFWGNTGANDNNGVSVTKAVILMTDGAFNQAYSADEGSSEDQAEAICDRMKTAGVVVYSVAFQAPTAGQEILADCATSADTYFEAETAEDLSAIYHTIASKLGQLRLTD